MNTERQDPRFVVCIDHSDFFKEPFPKKGDICEIEFSKVINGCLCYAFFGYNYILTTSRVGFKAKYFRPVDHDSGNAIAEWIESVLLKQSELESVE